MPQVARQLDNSDPDILIANATGPLVHFFVQLFRRVE
jgi:hypothetical protein